MKVVYRCICFWLASLFPMSGFAQENADSVAQTYKHNNAVFYDLSYIGDFVGNASGGLKTGIAYLGYAQFGLGIDFEELGWWKGGKLFVKGGNTHGGTPSETLLGDYQVADNIEAGNHTFLQELWFEQKLKTVTLRLGMQDFNADFAVCEASQLLLNSSFGIHSSLCSNITLPIFPTMAWAFNINWDITPEMYIRAGIYDSPIPIEENPYNIKWRFSKEKGFITSAEYGYNSLIKDHLPGHYSIGATYHTAEKEFCIHLCAEQTIWEHKQRSIELFIMSALCKKDIEENNNHFHIGGGVVLNKVFSKRGRDILSLGVTSAVMANTLHNETAIELSYCYQVHDNISLQPDIQYIIKPMGIGVPLKNALFLALRTEIAL